VWWRTELRRMDAKSVEVTLKLYLKQMRERLEQAASIAKAAETCAEAGNVEKGIEIALDIEQLIYEVNTFLNAASLINRIGTT
jgi:hypothetical protein